MLETLAITIGIVAVVTVLADMVNTLVTTQTAQGKWWLTNRVYTLSWAIVRSVAVRIRSDAARERLLGTFAPVSVLLLLVVWVVQQIVGFGLIWWGIGDIEGADTLLDSMYYSGVVYFTLGFGEIVPAAAGPRIGALVEAMAGVITLALVIGYLPALYAAYSERERKLLLLDDGTEDRITPSNLLVARAPDGDMHELFDYFAGWEEWIGGVIETHSTFPMLVLFRSKDPGQHWITALGVVTDAALTAQMTRGAENRAPYWMLRRSIRLFDQLTHGADLSDYRARIDEAYADEASPLFRQMYDQLADAGFDLIDFDEARAVTIELRSRYDAQLEYLIDMLLAPRGFWGHAVGHRMDGAPLPNPETPDT